MKIAGSVLFIFILLFSISCEARRWKNFGLKTQQNQDSVIRASIRGVFASETTIPGIGRNGLFYRQITNGKRLVKMIYGSETKLRDCDVTKNQDEIESFVLEFNSTKISVDSTSLSISEMKRIAGPRKFRSLMRSCRSFHLSLQKRRKKNTGKVRNKRGFLTQFIMYPGTVWCGVGNMASSPNDIGRNMATDLCCRTHDHCPYTITPFTKKYNIVNYRYHTVSHCDCDERFKLCLKRVNNGISDMVGSIYFNVLKLKCFKLFPKRFCIKRSWWGCDRETTRMKASIKNAIPFN